MPDAPAGGASAPAAPAPADDPMRGLLDAIKQDQEKK
jgi:hypothetical protein